MFKLLIPAYCIDHFDGLTPLGKVDDDKPHRFNVNGYNFDCYLRTCAEDPKTLFPPEAIEAEVDLALDEKALILALPDEEDEVYWVSSVSEGGPLLGTDECQAELNHLMDELETIARFAGKKIELLIHETKRMVPPIRSANTLKVVLGAVPPGYTKARHATHLFDVRIVQPGYRSSLPAPTIDVGHVVKNDIDEPIAQIVDDTIYLFVPMGHFGISQLVDPTVRLFRRAMNLAWNAYVDGVSDRTEPELTPVTDHHAYIERTLNPHQEIARLREELSEVDDTILTAQRVLTENLAKKARLVATIEGTSARIDYDPETAWNELTQCPYLESIYAASNGGVHYRSAPLILTDETGQARFIGQLGLSIERPDSIRVWSIDTPHRSGVPHPHVNHYGDVCLGNVTQSVSHLLAGHREAEAAILILRMLAEGYDPTLTEHKLSEWPTPEEWERKRAAKEAADMHELALALDVLVRAEIDIGGTDDTNESLAPVPHAEPTPDPSGDGRRRRFDWLLGRLRFGKGRSA